MTISNPSRHGPKDASPWAILHALSEPLAVVDGNGIISYVNTAWERWYAENTEIGSSLSIGSDFIAGTDAMIAKTGEHAGGLAEKARAVLAAELDSFELDFAWSKGEKPCWLHSVITGCTTGAGRCLLVHQYDITSTRQSALQNQQLLAEAQSARTRAETVAEISGALSRATDEEGFLAAIAHYADRPAPATLVLYYLDVDERGHPRAMTTAGIRKQGVPISDSPPVGARKNLLEFPGISQWLDAPSRITLIEDIAADPRVDGAFREVFAPGDHRCMALISLRSAGRWHGCLAILWAAPRAFTEDERSIYSLLTRATGAVVGSRRAFIAAEAARRRAEALAEINSGLSRAIDEQEILEVVARYAARQGASITVLSNMDTEEDGRPVALTVAAWIADGTFRPEFTGRRSPLTNSPTAHIWLQASADPVLVADLRQDDRIEPASRVRVPDGMLALAEIPLYNSVAKAWVGHIALFWRKPHTFTEEEREIYTAAAQTVTLAVASRRAQLGEHSIWAERRLLYEVSARLNAANSLEEIRKAAVTPAVARRARAATLQTIELDSAGRPEWSTVAASWSEDGGMSAPPVGTRFHILSHAPAQLWLQTHDQPNLLGDIAGDDRIDPHLRQQCAEAAVAAMVVMPLYRGGRWVGLIHIVWSEPQHFTERDRRLYKAISEQATALVESWLLFEKTQAALAENQKQRLALLAILHNLPIGVIVIDEKTRTVHQVNRKALSITGRGSVPETGPESYSDNYEVYFPGTDTLYPPAELPIARTLAGAGVIKELIDVKRPDGSRVTVESISAPILTEAGTLTSAILLLQDVTERRRAEEAKERFAAILSATSDLVGMANAKRRLLYLNKSWRALAGIADDDDVTKLSIDRLHPAWFMETFGEEWAAGAARHGTHSGEATVLDADGHEIAVSLVVLAHKNQAGEVEWYAAIARDITESKRAEEERRQLSEDLIRSQAAALAERSTPLIPITDDIMVMPLIGSIDGGRTAQMMETLLQGISQANIKTAILDITGVPAVDTSVASGIVRAAQAVRLLGVDIVLTGIRPEVARTLVHLGIDLSGIVTRSTLKSGIAYAVRHKQK